MKKILTKLTLTITLLFSPLILSACHDAVYSDVIRTDVAPEDADVNGNINSIARYTYEGKECLFLSANGTLLYKDISNRSHGAWHEKGLPFELHHFSYKDSSHKGEQIVKVLADKTYLYLLTVEYEDKEGFGTAVPRTHRIWAFNGESWNAILIDTNNILPYFDGYYRRYTAFNIFGTNSVNPDHRVVYIRSGNGSTSYPSKYYKLDGTEASFANPVEITAFDKGSGGTLATSQINSAAYLGDQLLFFNSIAAESNETVENPSTVVYYAEDDTLFYTTDGANGKSVLDVSNDISCFAACSDALLIGRADYSTSSSGGIVKIQLKDDGLPVVNSEGKTELSDFSTNARSQLTSSYYILTLLNSDPRQSEEDSALYASITFFGSGSSSGVSSKDIGLWSYYSERGNWNRE